MSTKKDRDKDKVMSTYKKAVFTKTKQTKIEQTKIKINIWERLI
jgi:hypothetical protein